MLGVSASTTTHATCTCSTVLTVAVQQGHDVGGLLCAGRLLALGKHLQQIVQSVLRDVPDNLSDLS